MTILLTVIMLKELLNSHKNDVHIGHLWPFYQFMIIFTTKIEIRVSKCNYDFSSNTDSGTTQEKQGHMSSAHDIIILCIIL